MLERNPDRAVRIRMLSRLTSHGRATPLLWLTVDTSTLQMSIGCRCVWLMALPADTKVCIGLTRVSVTRNSIEC